MLFFFLSFFFYMSINIVTKSGWVSLFCDFIVLSLLKRWVWGPLWSIRKTTQCESLFSASRPKAVFHVCCGCSALVQSGPTSSSPPAPLSYGMASPKGYHFPSIPVITECRSPWLCQWKIFLRKHTVQALLCGKNVNFTVFKRKTGGNLEIWTDSIPVHRLTPSLPSPLSLLFLSPSCLAFSNVLLVVSPSAYNSQDAWSTFFSWSKTTQNKT